MKTEKKNSFICIFTVVACLCAQFAISQSTLSWRGENRDGIYNETGLLKSWPEEGPQQLWETLDLGKGYSSPMVVSNRLYITGMNEDSDKEIFLAYSLDGKKIYETAYGTPWSGSYPETRTTPAIEGNKAYVISGSGEIVCINIEDGTIVWTVDGGTIFERKTGNWGTSECPLIFDNKVIFTPAGEQTTMVALNAQTGETVWKSQPLGDTGAYVSPILISYKGKRQIVGSTGNSVIGVNPETGNIEWTFNEWEAPPRERAPRDGAPRDSVRRDGAPGGAPAGGPPRTPPAGGRSNIAPNTPLFKDGRIFFCHGYNIGAYMLQLNDDLSEVTLAWKNNDLDTHHGHYVLIDNLIYGSNWISNAQGNWCAVDWNTGETRYENQWGENGKGSIIAADGMIYCYDERRGAVGLVKPNPEKFDVVSEFRITKGEGPHWAHPVINDGVMYIRHGSVLMAYIIK